MTARVPHVARCSSQISHGLTMYLSWKRINGLIGNAFVSQISTSHDVHSCRKANAEQPRTIHSPPASFLAAHPPPNSSYSALVTQRFRYRSHPPSPMANLTPPDQVHATGSSGLSTLTLQIAGLRHRSSSSNLSTNPGISAFPPMQTTLARRAGHSAAGKTLRLWMMTSGRPA